MNSFNLEETLKKPEFDALSPERRGLMLSLLNKLHGKNTMDSFAILTEFIKDMPKDDPLSPAEQELMTNTLLDSMAPPDRARFQAVVDMVRRMQQT